MAAHKIFIRTLKQDSVFIYNLFEALEGWAAYSTLPFLATDPYLDMMLLVPGDFLAEVRELLESLGDKVVILPGDPSKA